jgi:hypothetical protein
LTGGVQIEPPPFFMGKNAVFRKKNAQFEKLENFCELSPLEILQEIIFI